MKTIIRALAIFTVFLMLGLTAYAQPDPEIFGIGTPIEIERVLLGDGDLEVNVGLPFSDSIFYSIDPNTGIPTEIGPITGYTRCTGLDIHPITGEFFAVCQKPGDFPDDPLSITNNGPLGSYLVELNEFTGQPTEIGPVETFRGDFVSDISFRSDGTLFAHINALLNGAKEDATTNTDTANQLGIINTQNGQLNILGSTGLEDVWSAIGFNETDTLLQCTDNFNTANEVYTMNQTNGHSTFLGFLEFPPEFDSLRIVLSKDLDLSTNRYYAFLESEEILAPCCDDEIMLTRNETPEGNFLVLINQNSGDVDVVGKTSDDDERFGAIAVRSNEVLTQVPTLSEYGLIVTVVMLFGAAVFFLRRRQVSSTL